MQLGTSRHVRSRLLARTPASFSLLGLLLVVGSAVSTACGDDGSVLGSDTGGSAGQNSGGSAGNANSAGSAHAGTQASGGSTNNGGTANSGGSSDAGGAGGQASGGQASSDCVGTTCTSNQSCVAYRTVGGAVMPPDTDGNCMAGRHLEGNMCQSDFSYTCAELTGCSAPAATCRCAPNTACTNTTVCRLPSSSTWLDTSADLVCELLAP